MSTTSGSAEPEGPRPGRQDRGLDPGGMTEAEKRIAEWEARHDVAARGHRASPDVLQHYLAHERATHQGSPRTSAEEHGTPAPEAVPTAAPEPTTATRPRGLLSRLFRRKG